ncbi:unnamed protein product, partial [Choristocarpus tenellus]
MIFGVSLTNGLPYIFCLLSCVDVTHIVGTNYDNAYGRGEKGNGDVNTATEPAHMAMELSEWALGQGQEQGRGEGGGNEEQRIFTEFYSPLIGVFLWVGFPLWAAEASAAFSTQVCPLLAGLPLLRVDLKNTGFLPADNDGSQGEEDDAQDLLSMDFSLDVLIYSLFTLFLSTVTFWAGALRLFRSHRALRAVVLLSETMVLHFVWEMMIIKVAFPLEYVVFGYFLGWRYRLLYAVFDATVRVIIFRVVTVSTVLVHALSPLLPQQVWQVVETVWYHAFTYCLVGNRFLSLFFGGGGVFAPRPPVPRMIRRPPPVAQDPAGNVDIAPIDNDVNAEGGIDVGVDAVPGPGQVRIFPGVAVPGAEP